ncbi:hypothetical protein MLD38_005320 [Melastoma candidum]|uniref:Uncharacterized protein n=1 Tax=Melastoma candidum TaxID=119954 RepID=A0ACB9S8D7_9MYRT|nr:hypothetical protein MLD38_005320 [Melastoma candidum]
MERWQRWKPVGDEESREDQKAYVPELEPPCDIDMWSSDWNHNPDAVMLPGPEDQHPFPVSRLWRQRRPQQQRSHQMTSERTLCPTTTSTVRPQDRRLTSVVSDSKLSKTTLDAGSPQGVIQDLASTGKAEQVAKEDGCCYFWGAI